MAQTLLETHGRLVILKGKDQIPGSFKKVTMPKTDFNVICRRKAGEPANTVKRKVRNAFENFAVAIKMEVKDKPVWYRQVAVFKEVAQAREVVKKMQDAEAKQLEVLAEQKRLADALKEEAEKAKEVKDEVQENI